MSWERLGDGPGTGVGFATGFDGGDDARGDFEGEFDGIAGEFGGDVDADGEGGVEGPVEGVVAVTVGFADEGVTGAGADGPWGVGRILDFLHEDVRDKAGIGTIGTLGRVGFEEGDAIAGVVEKAGPRAEDRDDIGGDGLAGSEVGGRDAGDDDFLAGSEPKVIGEDELDGVVEDPAIGGVEGVEERNDGLGDILDLNEFIAGSGGCELETADDERSDAGRGVTGSGALAEFVQEVLGKGAADAGAEREVGSDDEGA